MSPRALRNGRDWVLANHSVRQFPIDRPGFDVRLETVSDVNDQQAIRSLQLLAPNSELVLHPLRLGGVLRRQVHEKLGVFERTPDGQREIVARPKEAIVTKNGARRTP